LFKSSIIPRTPTPTYSHDKLATMKSVLLLGIFAAVSATDLNKVKDITLRKLYLEQQRENGSDRETAALNDEDDALLELGGRRRRRGGWHVPHGHDPHGHIPHGHDPHAHIPHAHVPHGHDPHAHVPVDAAVQAVMDAADEVGDFAAETANAVGDFAVDASGNVINLVEDWANEAADALKTALDFLITAGQCLLAGPVECLMELLPS